MSVKSISDYLEEMHLSPDDIFSKEDAEKIINNHVVSFYKGRVSLREDKTFTGFEIAEKLHIIHSHFHEQFSKAWKEEFGDEYD